MLRLIRICAVGLASLLGTIVFAHAQAWRGESLEPVLVSQAEAGAPLVLVQDRPPLDGVISTLQSSYGPGRVKNVSCSTDPGGRHTCIVTYLTEANELIVVRVDARTGQILGGR